MEDSILLRLTYKGECKLVDVNKTSLFNDVVLQILGTWLELKCDNFSCKFTVGSVGSIGNGILGSDSDLRNMLLLCQHTYESIVLIEVTNITPTPDHSSIASNSVPTLNHDTFHVNFNEANNLGRRNLDVNHNMCCSGQNSYKKAKCSFSQVDFGGEGIILSYVMCPTEIQKSYLSDKWWYIMADDVGLEFIGGAVEFRKELIKYTKKLGFKFKYARNEKRYIHAVCEESHCDWFIKAKRNLINDHFVVDKANLVHQCVGNLVMQQTSRLVPNIIGDLVLSNVKSNPTISGKDIVREMKQNYAIDIDYWKAWRAVESTRNKVFGSYDESYDHLR
ncbi:hypothetical protein ACS0TY_033516 [Phlomoides rotata]